MLIDITVTVKVQVQPAQPAPNFPETKWGDPDFFDVIAAHEAAQGKQ